MSDTSNLHPISGFCNKSDITHMLLFMEKHAASYSFKISMEKIFSQKKGVLLVGYMYFSFKMKEPTSEQFSFLENNTEELAVYSRMIEGSIP